MNDNARILIVGAGVAGLTAAIWLGRRGIRPVVVERAKQIRADGFIISLSHESYRFAEELDLLPALRAVDARIQGSSYHSHSGRALLELDYGRLFDGVDVIQVMRDDLEEVLYEAAKPVSEFRFGTTIDRIEQQDDGVRVRFPDGSEETFDVVLGADGLRSTVRRLAFDVGQWHERQLGLCCAAFRLKDNVGLNAKFETHMERDRYMAIYASGNGEAAAVFVWQSDEQRPPPQAERLDYIRKNFAGAPKLTMRALDSCVPDSPVYMDTLTQIEMPKWHQGRVALLGDAAHCMTLLSGQGASAAFTGACHLGRALCDHEPQRAFDLYEAAMRPMVAEVQPMARRSARWYVPRSTWRHVARNTAMWALPSAWFYRHFKVKYSKG